MFKSVCVWRGEGGKVRNSPKARDFPESLLILVMFPMILGLQHLTCTVLAPGTRAERSRLMRREKRERISGFKF